MRKLLILGSDFGTLQVVKEAHKLGIYVIVADLMTTSPTKELADEAWLVSSTDTKELVKRCHEEGIDALMFGASDFNIWNARLVCKELGLPIFCESDYACRVARDKGEFKRICKQVGAPIATDYYLTDALTDEELDLVRYPVVVKPVDKSGNRGMSYCENKDELIEGYKKAREISEKEIIVERRLHGNEFNVHYVLADGHAQLLYFSSTHHEPGELENLYSFKVTTRHHLEQFINEVNEKAIAVIEKAECRDGIVWFDCIRDDDGHFYLLEMGYRFGGVMTYVPYEKVTGFNTVKWMLECALGIKHTEADLPSIELRSYRGVAASYHLFAKRSGVIGDCSGLDVVSSIPGVWVDCPKRTGNEVRALACSGLIGIYGEDIDDLCVKLRRVNKCLSFADEKGNELAIRFDAEDELRREYAAGVSE